MCRIVVGTRCSTIASPQNNHLPSLLILVAPLHFPSFLACDTVECGDSSGLLGFCLGGVLETSLHVVLLLRMNLECSSSRLALEFARGRFAGPRMVVDSSNKLPPPFRGRFRLSWLWSVVTADGSQRGSADRPSFQQPRAIASCHKCLITWGIF